MLVCIFLVEDFQSQWSLFPFLRHLVWFPRFHWIFHKLRLQLVFELHNFTTRPQRHKAFYLDNCFAVNVWLLDSIGRYSISWKVINITNYPLHIASLQLASHLIIHSLSVRCSLMNISGSIYQNLQIFHFLSQATCKSWSVTYYFAYTSSQFLQHFTCAFFVQNFGAKNYKAVFWVWKFLAPKYWQKSMRKMFMKLTPSLHSHLKGCIDEKAKHTMLQ